MLTEDINWTEFCITGGISDTYEAGASVHKVLAAFKKAPPGYVIPHQKEICEYLMQSFLQKIYTLKEGVCLCILAELQVQLMISTTTHTINTAIQQIAVELRGASCKEEARVREEDATTNSVIQ